jgi:hypothetical protein
MAFDGDSPFPFEVHIIEGLFLHVTFADGVGKFQQAVGECTLSMIDVGDNTKVANMFHVDDLGWTIGFLGFGVGVSGGVERGKDRFVYRAMAH